MFFRLERQIDFIASLMLHARHRTGQRWAPLPCKQDSDRHLTPELRVKFPPKACSLPRLQGGSPSCRVALQHLPGLQAFRVLDDEVFV